MSRVTFHLHWQHGTFSHCLELSLTSGQLDWLSLLSDLRDFLHLLFGESHWTSSNTA